MKTSAAAPSYGFDADAGGCDGACGAVGMLSSRVACVEQVSQRSASGGRAQHQGLCYLAAPERTPMTRTHAAAVLQAQPCLSDDA